ncbi:YHYH protein [Marinomonas sp. GJ51-6]|nr:YHYH protein [Marinomonas sp. GJ51-6]WOD08612.1 YHYH protein [Marinomonas sp. GJ51-6]
MDECNGQVTVTPEFPNGTYAYFLTDAFPVIPRCYKGMPSTDFTQQRMR